MSVQSKKDPPFTDSKGKKSDRNNASATEWCAGIIPVLKQNGSVLICVDLTHLNKAFQREIHQMPSVDENLGKLGDSKIFSKLDANSGFRQIPLDEESKLLTTFVTPFGRFCFNRLPFGISSVPEIFQRTMSKILEGSEGTLCQMDDVRGPTEDHCCDPIPSPFECCRDTAIHGDGKPSWEIHSPPG